MMRSLIYQTCMLVSLIMFAGTALQAQSVTGVWKTIDDESGEPKSHVKIYEENGTLYGKVIKLLPAAVGTICKECPGDKKGKPIEGMQIMWGLEKFEEGYWGNGEILDPKKGKVYNCKLWLENEDELTVRGYIGISLLGRSQSWYRVN